MPRAWVEGVLSDRIQSPMARLYRLCMMPSSHVFAILVAIRNRLYDRGWLHPKRVSCPVISVGSIEAGGTGKTPITLWLAERLHAQGKHVAILSRGYGRRGRGVQLVDPHSCSPTDVGDEPWMMAHRLPGVPVIVGSSRYAAARYAQNQGANLLLLDDGFQHRQLHRDLDIVVVSKRSPSRFLPTGSLRDQPKRIQQADLLITCDAGSLDPSLLSGTIHVQGAYDREGTSITLPKRIALFCGIAHPERWVRTLQDLQCDICSSLILADHQKPSVKRWQEWEQDAASQGAQALVCTEKDWVKGVLPSRLPVIWVRIEFRSQQIEERIQEILRRKGL